MNNSQPSNNTKSSNKLITILNELLIDNPWVFLFIVSFIAIVTLHTMPIFPSLNIKENIDIAGLFWGTVIILGIIERSIELFITAWRTSPRKILEQEIANLKEKTFQGLSKAEKEQIDTKKSEIDGVETEIAEKKNDIKNNNKTLEKEKQKLLKETDIAKKNTIQAVINTLNKENEQLNKEIEDLKIQLQTLQNEHLAILISNPIINDGSPESKLGEKIKELGIYKSRTAKYSLYLGLGFGFLASIAGIRIIEPLVDLSQFIEAQNLVQTLIDNSSKSEELTQQLKQAQNMVSQLKNFYKLDLVVSGLGISGGTKLFHGLPSLISDTLQVTRERINTL